MSAPIIRPARTDEYDEVARVWMDSWVSTGLEDASNYLLANLRDAFRTQAVGRARPAECRFGLLPGFE